MNYCEKCKRDLPEGEKCPVCTQKKGVFIEMEMPNCCMVCRFGRWNEFKQKWACYASNPVKYMAIKTYEREGRRIWCPLKPVKEDKIPGTFKVNKNGQVNLPHIAKEFKEA